MKLKNNEEKNDPLQEKETNYVEWEIEVFDQIDKLAGIIIDYLLKDPNENKKVVSCIRGNVTEPYLKEAQ